MHMLGMVPLPFAARRFLADSKIPAFAVCNTGNLERQGIHNAVGVNANLGLPNRGFGSHYRVGDQFLASVT